MAETKYQTTTTVTVIEKNSNGTATGIGTLPPNTEFTSDGTTFSLGTITYLRIAGSVTPSFTNSKTRAKLSSAGYYVIKSMVAELKSNGNSTSGTVNITATKRTGERVQLHNVTMGPGDTYTVKTGYTAVAYRGPGSSEYDTVKVYNAGQEIRIYATCRDDRGNIWASPTSALNSWVQFKTSGGQLNACFVAGKNTATAPATKEPAMTEASTASNGTVTNAQPTTYNDMETAKKNYAQALSDMNSMTAAAADCSKGLYNMQFVVGIPPKITPSADIQYMADAGENANNFGRCYTELFMASNTVVSIQPCKVHYLPNFSDNDKESFFSTALGVSQTAGDDNVNMLSGQLFEAQPDYSTYINSVNMLARAMSIYMNIGGEKYLGTGPAYKTMDYSWYRVRKGYNSPGLFGQIGDAVRAIVSDPFSPIMSDDTYMHFYATADGTSINESMTVSTRQTSLESLFNNNLAELAQEIQFLGGESFLNKAADFAQGLGSAIDAASGSGLATMVNNLAQYGGNYLKGGRMVFPQMLDDCRYDRSYTCSCRFISPSGDPEAIFLNCYLPLCYLLPYVLPQMLSDNMYTFPHLARVNCSGLFHCDLAAVTSLKIQRGGQDGTCWTADGLPFEVDVSFDITPLYSKLMVTGAQHPILFMSNSALHEYLGAMCGVSFLEPNLDTKINVLLAMGWNSVTGAVPSLLRSIYSSDLANWAQKLFAF